MVRTHGLRRYNGAALLAGYGWLGVAGLVWLIGGVPLNDAVYDVAIHAVFLGFGVSMIMAHAPLIFPAVLGRPLPYRPAMWLPLALLHMGLLVRVLGDALGRGLAWQIGSVITEIAKPSVDSAQYNIAANGVDNLIILRMSAEEFTMAMRGEREFNRLKGVDLDAYQCNTIFVDPPRAGLDDATVRLVQEYDNILYISCNPETLQANMAVLGETHEIARFALFDQFPWTHHMEAGVYLKRKAG